MEGGSFGHALLTSVGLTSLITALFVLKFRYWNEPKLVAASAAFFFALEWIGHRYLLPEAAFGPWLGYLTLSLTVPVVVAIVLLARHERRMGRDQPG